MTWMDELSAFETHKMITVNLLIDGYNVTYQSAWDKNRLVLQFFVDGRWKGEYSNPDSVIGQKFGRPKKAKLSKKQREQYLIVFGKRKGEKAIQKVEDRLQTYYFPYWTNSKSLIRHLKKTCEEITLM
jgi:hypothetical protein